jgi:hypothetical protein
VDDGSGWPCELGSQGIGSFTAALKANPTGTFDFIASEANKGEALMAYEANGGSAGGAFEKFAGVGLFKGLTGRKATKANAEHLLSRCARAFELYVLGGLRVQTPWEVFGLRTQPPPDSIVRKTLRGDVSTIGCPWLPGCFALNEETGFSLDFRRGVDACAVGERGKPAGSDDESEDEKVLPLWALLAAAGAPGLTPWKNRQLGCFGGNGTGLAAFFEAIEPYNLPFDKQDDLSYFNDMLRHRGVDVDSVIEGLHDVKDVRKRALELAKSEEEDSPEWFLVK